jgi:hypothetical protein
MIIEQSVHISVGERIIYMYFFGMKILDSLKFLIDSFKYQSKKRGILKEVYLSCVILNCFKFQFFLFFVYYEGWGKS